MKRYFLEIAYDGTEYHGWQIQPNAHSVQSEINKALNVLMSSQNIETIGCGRTDTGVHARQFFLHVDFPLDFNTSELVYKLNRILPASIAVFRLVDVPENAHARFDAVSRTYKYFIHTRKDPFLFNKSVYYHSALNIEKMNEASNLLLNYSDFTSFSKLHTDNKTNNCKISVAKWEIQDHQFIFTITADRFLRNMVRAIVGTLLDVGKGKLNSDQFCRIIESKDRGQAGESVSACGLYLQKIEYPYLNSVER